MKLFAPKTYGKQPVSYHRADDDLRDAVAGGCGPGGLGDYLVPDCIWGLCITPSCAIHDWMYHWGVTRTDKKEADDIFLDNMLVQIEDAGSWLRVRRFLARRYYRAVAWFGGPSFWDGKDEDQKQPITNI